MAGVGVLKGILITQCLQNDFVQPLDRYDPLPNQLHVGYEESRRLLMGQLEDDPVRLIVGWAYDQPESDLEIVHIRDWHNPDDSTQAAHLRQFGSHCIRNTPGADFVFSDRIQNNRQHTILDATGLNDFHDTEIAKLLDRYRGQPLRVGIMGVWTEAKVYFLTYEIATRYPEFQIAICSALCASSSRSMHFYALDQIRNILGVEVISSPSSFAEFLVGTTPRLVQMTHSRVDHSRLHWDKPSHASETDEELLLYLFRNSKEVDLSVLDGGYSGNLVLGARATDHMGHRQVPLVAKIGPRDLIAQERASFERIQEVLGNSAPAIVDSCELSDRGAILYRYASMLEGNVRTFQEFYTSKECESNGELLRDILDTVFKKQLGRLYAASEPEQLNLLQYYDFQPRYADGVTKRVNAIMEQECGSEIEILPGHQTPNPAYFYRNDLPHLKETTASHATGFIHGDLNGRNIILDSRDNVWLIDFFHTHRGHVIRDLVKLENDILFIMTNVGNDAELAEAFRFTDLQLGHSDLGIVPDESLADSFVFPQFRKAWKTLCILRSYYRSLIGSDRDPYQFHVAYLRYAVHTLSFDECNLYQKKWALYASGHLTRRVSATIAASQRLRLDEVPLDEDSHRRSTEPQKNPEIGKIYITILPGRKDRNRDIADDLEVIENLVSCVVCLVTPDELEYYGTSDLLKQYQNHNLEAL
ncbi:MAG: isochorismatase family protein, partial [Leptospiraceae bacterium]|nr:isochorismatase family protein [Leptospiraceae bacterium]